MEDAQVQDYPSQKEWCLDLKGVEIIGQWNPCGGPRDKLRYGSGTSSNLNDSRTTHDIVTPKRHFGIHWHCLTIGVAS